jgi:hypothetical protein
MDPNFITGVSDGESTFSFSISKSDTNRGLTITFSYSIELHKKDINLLKKIQSFFGVGKIQIRSRGGQGIYQVKSIKDLHNVIIPHFSEYPLLTKKRVDFELFKLAVDLMFNKEHLTDEGLRKIFSIKASLGKGISKNLMDVYPEVCPIVKSIIQPVVQVNNYWLAGFSSAEGSFTCKISKNSTTRIGRQVVVRFILIQHAKDTPLFKVIQSHLGCGVVREDLTKPYVTFSVSSLSKILDIIIPLYDKYSIQGIKYFDFKDFRTIAFLMKDNKHLTDEGLNEILNIKANMNSKRNI